MLKEASANWNSIANLQCGQFKPVDERDAELKFLKKRIQDMESSGAEKRKLAEKYEEQIQKHDDPYLKALVDILLETDKAKERKRRKKKAPFSSSDICKSITAYKESKDVHANLKSQRLVLEKEFRQIETKITLQKSFWAVQAAETNKELRELGIEHTVLNIE